VRGSVRTGVASLHAGGRVPWRNTYSFCRFLKEGKIDGQDLEERIGENPVSRWIAKEARRLRSCSEVKLRRIVSRRIVVGLTVSRSIRQKLRWG
jgi:hypothetical protein